MNHVDKYYWIIDHPKLTKGRGQAEIELTPHMVNPENEIIEGDITLNTAFRWWVEVTQTVLYEGEYIKAHDWDLDCGGETAEDAVETLYGTVLQKYGDY
ncbi:hypothetical protein NVP1187O_197 [Vibrio phage 1.187.O._10N.286.49.F1]|nr:hypothetical protein NVP1187O_197 [Vibrio phage 1.187.O._10N.286.49.F1]AUR94319.1 hypothetical protein NVP1193O_188 [Vibrio phage 1.193.O._10N.286.52.C6]